MPENLHNSEPVSDADLRVRYDRAVRLLAAAAQADCATARSLTAGGKHRDALAYLARACDYVPDSTFAAEQAIAVLNSADLHSPVVILDHRDAVWSAEFSADGRRVVTAS
jgi:hypothetical protein